MNNDATVQVEEAIVRWEENGTACSARWYSGSGAVPPRRVQVVDDTLTADAAHRLACEGTALLWRGDFQNARQLLQAVARRVEHKSRKKTKPVDSARPMADTFNLYRMAQAQRARILNMLLVPLDGNYQVPLRRAPDVRQACLEVLGPNGGAGVVALRDLQGLIGAYEWRRKGVPVPALKASIHPHYGVFSPIRGEYVDLVANEPLPVALGVSGVAFDIGTGTGVLAAVLAQRGVSRIVATDQAPWALVCANENLVRLGVSRSVQVIEADLFPPGRAALVVCNPPWLPGKPGSPLETAVYDPESRMLRGFLAGLATHLEPGGEGWLILSDLAEHLGLRSRETLLAWIDEAGLRIGGRRDIRPRHPKANDPDDPLHAARVREVTSLWRLLLK